MAWLDRLAAEISKKKQSKVSASDLYAQLQRFRRDCPDPLLKDSYPEDWHHLKKSDAPQASTSDIILSFMNEVYPGITTPFVTELAERLRKTKSRRPPQGQIDRILAKERVRRYASGSKKRASYWGLNEQRVISKYTGLYALLRIDSGKALQAEPFAIVARSGDPTTVSAFWLCGGRLRVGDLLLNTYRFSGITVCRSTDLIIEPVSISLLRAARPTRNGQTLPLILGGFVVGWKDDDPRALFHTRIALIKLNTSLNVADDRSFEHAITQRRVQARLAALKESSSVRQNLVPNFLEELRLHMSQLDARNALPDLTDRMVAV